MLLIILFTVLVIGIIIARKANKKQSTIIENKVEETPLGYETGSYNPEPVINVPVEKAAEVIADNVVKSQPKQQPKQQPKKQNNNNNNKPKGKKPANKKPNA
jgi:hypothetical protein